MRSILNLMEDPNHLLFINPYSYTKFTRISKEEYLSLYSICRTPIFSQSGVFNHRTYWEWKTWYRREEIKMLKKANLPFFYRHNDKIYI